MADLINTRWVYMNIIPVNNRRKFSHLDNEEKSIAYGIIIELLFDGIKEELLREKDSYFSPHNPPRHTHTERHSWWRSRINGSNIEIARVEIQTTDFWVPKHIWIDTANNEAFQLLIDKVKKRWTFPQILQEACRESEICKSSKLPHRVKTLFATDETA